MARLIVSINVTLDGCCHHTQAIADEEHHRYATALLDGATALLLGRNTYDLFRSHWPAVARSGEGRPEEVAFARLLDETPRYVVTSRALPADWEGSVRVEGDLARAVPELKEALRGDLVVFGSPRLARALAELACVDEYHLAMQPILAGRGPRLFDGLANRQRLVHHSTRVFRSGVMLSRFLPHAPAWEAAVPRVAIRRRETRKQVT